MPSHSSKSSGQVESSSRTSPTQRKKSTFDALHVGKDASILPSCTTHVAKVHTQPPPQQQQKPQRHDATPVKNSKTGKSNTHASAVEKKVVSPHAPLHSSFSLPALKTAAGVAIVGSERETSKQSTALCKTGAISVTSSQVHSHENSINTNGHHNNNNDYNYYVKSQASTRSANVNSAEGNSSKTAPRGSNAHHLTQRLDRAPSTDSSTCHEMPRRLSFNAVSRGGVVNPCHARANSATKEAVSSMNSSVCVSTPTASGAGKSVSGLPAAGAGEPGLAGVAVCPLREQKTSPMQEYPLYTYNIASPATRNNPTAASMSSSSNRAQSSTSTQDESADAPRRMSQPSYNASLPQLKQAMVKRDGAAERVTALSPENLLPLSSAEGQQGQDERLVSQPSSCAPNTSEKNASVRLKLNDGSSESSSPPPSTLASSSTMRKWNAPGSSSAAPDEEGTQRMTRATLMTAEDGYGQGDAHSLLNSMCHHTSEDDRENDYQRLPPRQDENQSPNGDSANNRHPKHGDQVFQTPKSDEADTLSCHTEPHLDATARGNSRDMDDGELAKESGGVARLESGAEPGAMNRVLTRRCKYMNTFTSKSNKNNNTNANNNSSSRKAKTKGSADGGGLAIFDTTMAHSCSKCGNDAIEYVSEDAEEEMYMCEDCYFADYGAHRMVPIRDTHCLASRTLASSSYSALTSSNVVSSLLYNPCNECGRMIDDTEAVYRCEKCDFIVCDACFCTRTIQHEDELRRFQRRNPNDSVYETTFVNRSRTNEGNKIINDYVIVRFLGEGSSAKVKLVQHIRSRELFALKIMRVNGAKTTGVVTRVKPRSSHAENVLAREVAVMKFVSHPNIVQLQEVIEDVEAHKVYIIMEYCSGGPIHTWSKAPLSLEKVRKYGADILRGLLHLHSEYLFHRDVKPANCLVNCHDVAKLADFGTCSSHVKSSTAYGTMPYNSPEQIRGENVSGEIADSWAFAMTLYQSAFGKLPFGLNTLWEVRNGIGGPDPVQFPAECDVGLLDLLQKMLDKNLPTRLLLSGAARHPFFRNLCDDINGSNDNGNPLYANADCPYENLSLLMSSDEATRAQQQESGTSGEKDLTKSAKQHVADLYSQASNAVVRGNNVKDFFHGVKPIMLMRRRLRKQNSNTSMSGSNSIAFDRGGATTNSNSTDEICMGKSGECDSQSPVIPSSASGANVDTKSETDQGRDACTSNPKGHCNKTPLERSTNCDTDARRDAVMDSPCAIFTSNTITATNSAWTRVKNSLSTSPVCNPAAASNAPISSVLMADCSITRGPTNGVAGEGQNSSGAQHDVSLTRGMSSDETRNNSTNHSKNTTAATATSEHTCHPTQLSSLERGDAQQKEGVTIARTTSGNTSLLPMVLHHSATTDLIKHVRVYIPEAPASLNAYSSTVVRMVFTFNELSSVSNINFGSFVLLKDVTISSNNLTSFPEGVLAAPRLQRLDLSNSKITCIPATVRQAYFLERINLYNNMIESVGVDPSAGGISVLSGPCLRHVRLSANPLQSLPAGLDVPRGENRRDTSAPRSGGCSAANSLPDLQIVLDANPRLMSEWSMLLQYGATNPCWRSVVIIWDDYFPTYVSGVPYSIWIGKGHVSLYQPHILRSCGVKHVVINSVDRRLPVGILTGPQLQSYFAKASSSSSAGGSFSCRSNTSSNRSSSGDGLADEQLDQIASMHSSVEQAKFNHSASSMPLLQILSKEASDMVYSYFFISANVRNLETVYIALARYFHHILMKNEGLLVLTNSTTGETFETALAALSDVLHRVSDSENDVKYYCEKVMSALCGLYD